MDTRNTVSDDKKESPEWVLFKEIELHSPSFYNGIVIAKPTLDSGDYFRSKENSNNATQGDPEPTSTKVDFSEESLTDFSTGDDESSVDQSDTSDDENFEYIYDTNETTVTPEVTHEKKPEVIPIAENHFGFKKRTLYFQTAQDNLNKFRSQRHITRKKSSVLIMKKLEQYAQEANPKVQVQQFSSSMPHLYSSKPQEFFLPHQDAGLYIHSTLSDSNTPRFPVYVVSRDFKGDPSSICKNGLFLVTSPSQTGSILFAKFIKNGKVLKEISPTNAQDTTTPFTVALNNRLFFQSWTREEITELTKLFAKDEEPSFFKKYKKETDPSNSHVEKPLVAKINSPQLEEKINSLVLSHMKNKPREQIHSLKMNLKLEDFQGVSTFVTAGCMLSGMLAYDDKNQNFPLIKHGHNYGNNYIRSVAFLKNVPNLYKKVVLGVELDRIASLIDRYSDKNKDEKKLIFHLPCKDYMLFGALLYLWGRIELDVLGQFYGTLLNQEILYKEEIAAICKTHNISVEILSPFENLFSTDVEAKTPIELASKILGQLKLPTNVRLLPFKHLSEEQCAQKEREIEERFVQRCITGLRQQKSTTASSKLYADIWNELLTTEECKQIQFLELEGIEGSRSNKTTPHPTKNNPVRRSLSLFSIANTFPLALASYQKKDYEAASIIGLPEKNIQNSFAKRLETLRTVGKGQCFGNIINLTTASSVVTFDPTREVDEKLSGTFYFNVGASSFDTLIERGILAAAKKNISFFASGATKREELVEFLDRTNKPSM